MSILPLILAGLGIQQIRSSNKEQKQLTQQSLLQQGIKNALGTAPGIFDTPLFPGEQQIPGLQTSGTGLLADPNNQRNQLQFGADIFGLRGQENAGQSLIEQALSFGQQQQNQQNKFDFTSQENLLDRNQNESQFQQKFNESRRITNLQNTGLNDPSLGAIATGSRRIEFSPGEFADIPNQGSPRYTKAAQEIKDNETGVELIDELITEVTGENGFEVLGRGAGRQKILYEALVAQAQVIFKKGALQGDERQEIERALRNPTAITPGTTDAEIIAGYIKFKEILQRGLRQKNQLYQAWGLGSQLDKTTPSQLRSLQAQRVVEEKAAALGLTITPEPIEAKTRKDSSGVSIIKDIGLSALLPPGKQIKMLNSIFKEAFE